MARSCSADRGMAAGERSIWRVMLCAEAENIEQADAISAAAGDAFQWCAGRSALVRSLAEA
ncbi:hypothetical protein C1170_10400 [Stutzerimonas frequens]|nr:hypothetical protein C1170_10400 [Stutzerimonas frequens]